MLHDSGLVEEYSLTILEKNLQALSDTIADLVKINKKLEENPLDEKLSSDKSTLISEFNLAGDRVQNFLFDLDKDLTARSEEIHQQANHTNRTSSQVTFVLLVVSTAFISLILLQVFSSLNRLNKGVREISSGNLDIKLGGTSSDEFGQLAFAFDQMVTKVKGRRQELEQQVAQRTQELEQAKQGLEQQVAQRTTDLESKIMQLSKMNELMVNRELKLIEYKKEISDLRGQIGSQNPNPNPSVPTPPPEKTQ